MPSPFQERLNEVGDRFDEVNGEEVTYDDGTNSNTITANPILKEAEEIIPQVSITRMEFFCWGISLAALQAIIGANVLPAVGHKITRANGEIFRLQSFGGDEPPYKFVTGSRERVLVNTIQIKKADP